MNTKKFYVAPVMNAVEIGYVTLLAGSGEMGIGATIGGRGDLEDDYQD